MHTQAPKLWILSHAARGSLGGYCADEKAGVNYALCSEHVVSGFQDCTLSGSEGLQCRRDVVRSRRGIVQWQGSWYFVDAALISLQDSSTPPLERGFWRLAKRGEVVTKWGAESGLTVGCVENVEHVDETAVGPFRLSTPNQLLICPYRTTAPFAARGDSGALVHGEDGKALGLIWGTRRSGVSIACPIGPVLSCLAVSLRTEVGNG